MFQAEHDLTPSQRFALRLQSSADERLAIEASLEAITQQANARRGYSLTEANKGKKLATIRFGQETGEPQRKIILPLGHGQDGFVTIGSDELSEILQLSEEYAAYILTETVHHTADYIVRVSGYTFDETRAEDAQYAVDSVRALFKKKLIPGKGEKGLSSRDQWLVALLGSGYLTGRDVFFETENTVTVDWEHSKGNAYIDPKIIHTLGNALYKARNTLTPDMQELFLNTPTLNLYFRETAHIGTVRTTAELQHAGYNYLIAYYLKEVFSGESPLVYPVEQIDFDTTTIFTGG